MGFPSTFPSTFSGDGPSTTTPVLPGGGFQNAFAVAPTGVGHSLEAASGADVAGVHVSVDGVSWTPSNEGLPETGMRVAGLAFSQTVADRLYAYVSSATGAPVGGIGGRLMRGTYSPTGGTVTWVESASFSDGAAAGGSTMPRQTGRMLALDEANNVAFVGSINGVHLISGISGTGTVTATRALTGAAVTGVVLNPSDTNIGYATVDSPAGSAGIWRIGNIRSGTVASTRNSTFTNPQDLCIVDEGAQRVVYAACMGQGVRSWVAGADITTGWTDRTGALTLGSDGVSAIDARGSGATTKLLVSMAGTPTTLNAGGWSNNQGGTWSNESSSWTVTDTIRGLEHPWWLTQANPFYALNGNGWDSMAVRFDPADTTKAFMAGRSGIWSTLDSGASWRPAIQGLSATVSWGVQAAPTGTRAIAYDGDWGPIDLPNKAASAARRIEPGANPGTGMGVMFRTDTGRVALALGDWSASTNGEVYVGNSPYTSWTDLGFSAVPSDTNCCGVAIGLQGANEIILTLHDGTGIQRKVGTAAPTTVSTGVTNGFYSLAKFWWPNSYTGTQGTVYLSASNGLWRSLDYGATWTRTLSYTNTSEYTGRIVGLPTDPVNTLFLTINGSISAGLYKVTNAAGSSTLTLIEGATDPGPCTINSSGLVYFAVTANEPGGVKLYRSDSANPGAATTFTDVSNAQWRGGVVFPSDLSCYADGDVLASNKQGGYFVFSLASVGGTGEDLTITPASIGTSARIGNAVVAPIAPTLLTIAPVGIRTSVRVGNVVFSQASGSEGYIGSNGPQDITPTVNYSTFGGPSSSGCTNSVVTTSGSGVIHDNGGAAAATPNGTNPAVSPGAFTFWNDSPSPLGDYAWRAVRQAMRIDLDTQSTAGYYWAQQGYLNAAAGGTGNVWYMGLQSRSSLSGNPKALNFAIWNAVDAVAGNVPGTIAAPFSGEGVGYQVMAPFSWVAGRSYTLQCSVEPDRGTRWFRVDIRDDVTGVITYHGSIRASTLDSSYLRGVRYDFTELFSQVTTATTCPLLPRATTFFAAPTFSLNTGADTPSIPTGAIPNATIEIAFDTDPLSTSPVWTDVTDYVILQEGELQITRGAADEFSAMQPSILTLWLDNSDGRFTRGLSTSPYYPNVKNGKRIRVSLDFNGNTYRRFDGHINNWPTAWKVTGSVPYIPVQITAIDRFDRLNKRGELRSVIEEEYLRDITGAELLPGVDSTFEGTAGNWALGGGISAALASTEQARSGSYSMKMTASGSGVMWTKNDGSSSAGATRVVPGEKISIGAWLRAGSTPRDWRAVLRYGDSNGAYVTQTNGPYVNDAAGTWTYVSLINQPVPAGVATVYAQIETGTVPPSGENHYADDVSITIGSRPGAYYPLSEASGSTSAANVGPYSQGPVYVLTFIGEGDIDFGSGTGPGTDELSAPSFLPTSPTNGGKYLSGELLTPVGGNKGLTLEAFLRAPRATNTRDIVALETTLGRRAELSFNVSGQLVGFTTDPNGVKNYTLTSSSIVNDNSTHHVALTESIRGTTVTARLYRDGVEVGTTTYSDTAIEQYRMIYIGGEPVFGQLFEGTISHVGAYSTALPVSRIATHANAGKTSLIERSDQRIARIADWIGIPVTDRNLDVGDTMVGWQGTSGQQAITAMQEAEATEGPGSALFMSGDNKLTFHSQIRRANSTVFLTLDATDAAQIGTELEFPGDDFGLFNDVTVERPREGPARWINQSSIDTYGLYRTSISTIHAFDVDALAAAQWIAESYGTPKNRTPNVTCDLFVLVSRGTATTLVETILQTEISKKLRLINLPPEAPVTTLDQFVEGTVETISIATWTIQFLCSPGDFANVWQLGVTGYSELGLTTTLGL